MRKTLGSALLFALILCLSAASPAFAGKPAGGSTLPKVRFQIQYFVMPHGAGGGNIDDMNSYGETVGWYLDATGQKRAFVFLPNLNSQTAYDLNDLVAAPAGWIIASAVGINDHGIIVGSLSQTGSNADPNARRGFVLDTGAPTLSLQSLPDSAWTNTSPWDINDNGDIVGLYSDANGAWYIYIYNPADDIVPITMGPAVKPSTICLNNPQGARPAQVGGQLADGTQFRWTPGFGLETVPTGGLQYVYGINDAGTLCGAAYVKGKFATALYTSSLVTLSGGQGIAYDINNGGDVIVGDPATYYQAGWGFMSMSSLIDTSDPDYTIWKSGASYLVKLGERDSTNFGKVCGETVFSDGSHTNFVLTPVSIP